MYVCVCVRVRVRAYVCIYPFTIQPVTQLNKLFDQLVFDQTGFSRLAIQKIQHSWGHHMLESVPSATWSFVRNIQWDIWHSYVCHMWGIMRSCFGWKPYASANSPPLLGTYQFKENLPPYLCKISRIGRGNHGSSSSDRDIWIVAEHIGMIDIPKPYEVLHVASSTTSLIVSCSWGMCITTLSSHW